MTDSFRQKSPATTFPFLTNSRILYLLTCSTIGLYMGSTSFTPDWFGIALGGIAGFVLGCLALWLEAQLATCSRSTIFGGSLGLLIGLIGTCLVMLASLIGLPGIPSLNSWILISALLLFPYLGLTMGLYFSQPEPALSRQNSSDDAELSPHIPAMNTHVVEALLDSSSIIDGRILYLCTTGFLEGPLLIPKCVLREIYLIADSDDLSKRTKGKRGLAIVSDLQQLSEPQVMVIDDQEALDLTVDHQLIALAKDRKAKIITNDWNLAKMATAQGVKSLNVNELTYHLRPLVLPGECIRVYIQKEGQGLGQGIAHLDDGTIVVIEHGADFVGGTIDVEVTRFMQTNTGRMVFAFPRPPVDSPAAKRSSHSLDASVDMTLETAGANQE